MDGNILGNMKSSRAAIEAKGYENYGLASHVLLAACKLSERALERDGRGAFTQALLKLLRDSTIRTDAITYKETIERLDDLPAYVFRFVSYPLNSICL
jgi:hypothetical protein